MTSSWRLVQHGKSFGFGVDALRRHPAIVPMVAIISGVVVFVSSTCVYFAAKKMDVQIVGKQTDYERMDLSKPQYRKLLNIQQEVKPMPKLQELLKEINEG